MPKVSVIIPVYGVEKFIEKCARSLFEQTLDDIEYLFIDDCTPDKSVEILINVLSQYPNRKDQVRIIKMDHNSGQAAVRKRGVLESIGEYVIHCDSDDWVDKDMYQAMYDKAVNEESDVVICDFCRTGGRKKTITYGCHSTDVKIFIENCLYQKDHWSLCNKLFKKKCYDNIVFPSGALGEDMMMCIQMLYKCQKISYINKVFYFYYFNPNSITKKSTIENRLNNFYILQENTFFITTLVTEKSNEIKMDVELICKYLKMVNSFSLLSIRKLPEYKKLWEDNRVHMPIRFFFNNKISYYNKIRYILSTL